MPVGFAQQTGILFGSKLSSIMYCWKMPSLGGSLDSETGGWNLPPIRCVNPAIVGMVAKPS